MNDFPYKPIILVVDDLPENITIMSDILSPYYHVKHATNGKKAIDIASSTPPCLILLDIIMPDLGGYEVCKRLKDNPKTGNIPVIFVTSLDEVEDERKGFELGAVDYITRPISSIVMLARIRTHISLYDQNRELERIVALRTTELVQINENLKNQIDLFHKFVPREFCNTLCSGAELSESGLNNCVDEILTVMFVDIHSFTAMSESMGSKETFKFVNNFLGQMCPVIRKNGGIIDKYIGDAIMVLFRTSEEALRSSIELCQQLLLYNKDRARFGYRPISIGIGLHSGHTILGTVGEGGRIQTTVIGDVVNVAARTEYLTREYKVPVLLTETTYLSIENTDQFQFRQIDCVTMKGKKQSITVYECLDAYLSEEEREKRILARDSYEKGLNLFNSGNIADAISEFQKSLNMYPEDKATRMFLSRCWKTN